MSEPNTVWFLPNDREGMGSPPLATVSTIVLGPEDRVVVAVPQEITSLMSERLRAYIAERLGIDQSRVLVLDGGVTLTVVRKDA